MLIRFIKQSNTHNSMECIRLDGSITRCSLPDQGTLPRTLIQFVVEDAFNIRQGIFGTIAAGGELPADETDLYLDQTPSNQTYTGSLLDQIEHIEILRTEALVQCFQTEMLDSHWRDHAENIEQHPNAGSDSGMPGDRLQKLLAIACEHRHVEPPEFPESQIQRVRSRLQTLSRQWHELPVDSSVELRWSTTTLWLGGEEDGTPFIATP